MNPSAHFALLLLPKLDAMGPDELHAALIRLLDDLLREPPPINQHLEILETVRTQVARAQGIQALRYAAHPLPPDGAENATLLKVVSLWRAMAQSYARIAQQDAPRGTLAGQHTLLLQRRLHYTGQALLEYLRAHRAVPAGFWAGLHECYLLAERAGTARVRVSDALNEAWAAQSALESYAAVLLVELANPFGRDEREFAQACAWARRFAPYCDLEPCADPASRQAGYGVDLNLDQTLRPLGLLKPSPGLRVFNGSRLAAQIKAVYGRLKRGGSPASLGLGEDYPAAAATSLLVSLYRRWGLASASRRFPRRGAHGQVMLCGDWQAIGYHVDGRIFEQPRVGGGVKSLRDDIRLMTFGERVDETGHLHAARDCAREAERLGFAGIRWQITDQSVGGFRLTQAEEHERLEHRQLIGLLPPDGERFLLARISWLMYREDGVMEIGVHILPGLPEVVAVRIVTLRAGNRGPYSQAFLLPGAPMLKTENTLVLPEGWFQAGRVLELVRAGLPTQVRLLRGLENGPNFAQATFELVRGL